MTLSPSFISGCILIVSKENKMLQGVVEVDFTEL